VPSDFDAGLKSGGLTCAWQDGRFGAFQNPVRRGRSRRAFNTNSCNPHQSNDYTTPPLHHVGVGTRCFVRFERGLLREPQWTPCGGWQHQPALGFADRFQSANASRSG
jgi:hypothetical protein